MEPGKNTAETVSIDVNEKQSENDVEMTGRFDFYLLQQIPAKISA